MTEHYNGLGTAALIGALWMVLLAVGALIARGTGSAVWILVFAAITLVQAAAGYWNSDKIALRAMSTHPSSSVEAPELYQIVQNLAAHAGQPMPGLYIAPTKTSNAFATGRDPEHAAVCVTEGTMDLLELRELRAVLDHELSHVYNRDILTSSVVAGIAGVVTSITQFAPFFGGGRDREGNGGMGILLALVTPFAASLTQFSISRTREFDTDEDGARLTNDPLALTSALKKLETGTASTPLPSTPQRETVSSMMVVNPSNVKNLFSTHPPMDERIRRLEKMAGY